MCKVSIDSYNTDELRSNLHLFRSCGKETYTELKDIKNIEHIETTMKKDM